MYIYHHVVLLLWSICVGGLCAKHIYTTHAVVSLEVKKMNGINKAMEIFNSELAKSPAIFFPSVEGMVEVAKRMVDSLSKEAKIDVCPLCGIDRENISKDEAKEIIDDCVRSGAERILDLCDSGNITIYMEPGSEREPSYLILER